MDYELQAINSINFFLSNYTIHNLRLYSNNTFVKEYSNISRIEKIPSFSKADFAIIDNENNHIFISHKKTGGAKSFQQYSGISLKSGDNIYRHPEIQFFLKKIIGFHDGYKITNPFFMKIKDPILVNYSLFGHEFGYDYSKNNIHYIVQGNPEIQYIDNTLHVNFKELFLNNNHINTIEESYTPIIAGTYRRKRSFSCDNISYSNYRVGIYPLNFIKNRKEVIEIINFL